MKYECSKSIFYTLLDEYPTFSEESISKIKKEIQNGIDNNSNVNSLLLVKNKHLVTDDFVNWLIDNNLIIDFLKLYGFWKCLKENNINDFFITNEDLIEKAADEDEHILFHYAFYKNNLDFITDDIYKLRDFLKTNNSVNLLKTIQNYKIGKKILRNIFDVNDFKLITNFLLNKNDKQYYEYILIPDYIQNTNYEKMVVLFSFLDLYTEYLRKVENVSNKNIYEIEETFIPKYFFSTKKVFSACKTYDNFKFLKIFDFHHHPYWTIEDNTKKTITRDANEVFTLEGDDVNGYNKTVIASFKEILPVCYDEKIKDYIYIDVNGDLKSLTHKDIKDSELALFVDVNKKYKFIIKESPNKYTWKTEDNIQTNYGNAMIDYDEIITRDLNIKNVNYSKIYTPSVFKMINKEEIAFFPFTKDFREVKNRYSISPRYVSIEDKSLLFSGTRCYTLNTPTDIYNNNFTVSLWVKDFSGGVIFGTTHYLDYITITAGENKLGFSLRADRWFDSGYGRAYYVNSKQWHQVVIMGNRKIIKFYIDGVCKGETSNIAAEFVEKYYTILGAIRTPYEGFHSYYKGRLKKLRIYNTMLSEEEVSLLYLLEGEDNV